MGQPQGIIPHLLSFKWHERMVGTGAISRAKETSGGTIIGQTQMWGLTPDSAPKCKSCIPSIKR